MKHTLWFIGVLLIAVTLCGCGAAVPPDSEAPLSNRAVEFFCTDGESHCWTVQQLEAGTAQCVSSHTAPLQELQFWQEDFVSYLPLYQMEE